jgi:tricorn protease
VTFVYAGDVWTVPIDGGTAARLSSPPGEEIYPRFAPDGQHIAFTGNYDGNEDVYVLPTGGGTPTRLTHHVTTDRVLDWTPDGTQVLYASNMESGRKRYNQVFRVDQDGGFPEKLPVPYAEYAALSPDGAQLAFAHHGLQSTWKRYRGGMAPDLFVMDLESLQTENVTNSDANEGHPMWHGGTLYFLSDRGPAMRYNLWVYDTETEALRQVTSFTDVDVHTPAIGPSHIVFEAGGQLHLLDLSDETHAPLDIDVVTDHISLKPRVESAEGYTRSATVSPDGKRAIVEARGELFSLPTEHGVIRTISRTPGAAERYPQWSPNGSEVAYWTDRNDDWQLAVRPADGSGEETLLTDAAPGYGYPATWSPDGSKLAYRDETRTLYVIDRETGERTAVDQDRWSMHYGLLGETVSWSSDSRWLAYDRYVDNGYQAVFLYDTQNGQSQQVTSGFYSAHHPAFDPDGKYLYVLTDRELSPSYSDLQPTWVYANTTQIAAIPLRDNVASPLHPRNDEVEVDDEDASDEDGNGDAADEATDGEDTESVEVDLENFERRMVLLPPDAGRYADLQAASGKVIYRRLPRTGSGDDASPLVIYDLEEREEKTVLGDADQAELAAGGTKLLVQQRGKWGIIDLAPDQKLETPLRTGEMEMTVHPREEWQQMFDEAWRLYRDWFYDPEIHQVDWNAMHEQYRALLEDAVTRWDVNFVIGELIGEVNASHTYRGGGDTPDEPRRRTGLLGVEWSLENDAYRIDRIYRGAPWDDAEVRSPLDAPGVNVEAGTYVLAVNGTPIDTSKDPWAAFDGLEGKTVELTVNGEPTMDGARTVLVETLSGRDEVRLQYLDWVNSMRERVDDASDGRIGYVYVPNTAGQGQTELVRQFVAQAHKDGLIIDERFNSGGQLGDRFMELLNRPIYSYIAPRDGPPQPWPPVSHTGPQAMLINGWSASGGDAFPWYFQQAERGPVIGTRTWGGLIGPAVGHRLVDNGVVVVPPARLYGPDGEWFAEGRGVEPDIAVPEDPGALARGTDRQLERAIEEVLRALDANPPQHPEKPPYVDRSRPQN